MEKWWKDYPVDLNFTPAILALTQENGIGQRDRIWLSDLGSLTFSTLLELHPQISWTPLECSVLLCEFIYQFYHVECKLKWPNDLYLYNQHKVAGILCQGIKKKLLLGIGINVTQSENVRFQEINAGFLNSSTTYHEQNFSKIETTAKFIQYAIKNRHLNFQETKSKWICHCAHMGSLVTLHDKNFQVTGLFEGLTDFGEAIITDSQGKEHYISTGLLTINQSSNTN